MSRKDPRRENLAAMTAERASSIVALDRFIRIASEKLQDASNEGFDSCLQAFSNLGCSNFLTELVNLGLQRFLDDPKHIPLMSFVSQVVIAETDDFQLNLGFFNDRSAPVTNRAASLPSSSMLQVLAGELTVTSYEQREPYPCDVFRSNAALTLRGERTCQAGEILTIRAGFDVLDFRPVKDSTALVLSFSQKRCIDYAWEYDLTTLMPVRAVPGDANWSRLDYALQIFMATADASYLPTMRLLSKHPAHFIRWSAVSAAVVMDCAAGLELLENARYDEHPEIRFAATRTFDVFNGLQASAS